MQRSNIAAAVADRCVCDCYLLAGAQGGTYYVNEETLTLRRRVASEQCWTPARACRYKSWPKWWR